MDWIVAMEDVKGKKAETVKPDIKDEKQLQELTAILDYIVSCHYDVVHTDPVEDDNYVIHMELTKEGDLIISYPKNKNAIPTIHSAAHFMLEEEAFRRRQFILYRMQQEMAQQNNIVIPKANPGLANGKNVIDINKLKGH